MSRYAVSDYDIPSGAVVDTFKTIAALKTANTAGHRGRLRKVTIGGAGQTPQDIQMALRISKTDNTADGTGDNALTVAKLDAADIASVMTAKSDYSVEPTTVSATPFLETGFNARGTPVFEWAPGEGPLWGINETLVLQVAPGEATAVPLAFSLEWDE